MKLEDLKQDFAKSVESSANSSKMDELAAAIKTRSNKYDRSIKIRDFLEIGVSILLIPVWIYGLTISQSWMQSLGYSLAIISCIYIPYKLINAKRLNPLKDDSLKAYLIQQRQKVAQQKRLLETVVWWYIAPIFVSIMLITLGANVDEQGVIQLDTFMQIYYLLLVLLMVGIYFLNKKAAEDKFGTLLTRIEKQLNDLNTE